MSNRLLMIRHGESESRFQERYIGKTDASLSSNGRRQAALLSGFLAGLSDVTYLCSPLARVRETAKLALGSEANIEINDNLREIDFGLWEGMSFAEIETAWPEKIRQWSALQNDFTFPEGDSIETFRKRTEMAAERIVKDHAETTVVFTHGGVIRFLICYFLGLANSHYLSFEIAPASLSEIMIYDSRGVLTLLNNREHYRTGLALFNNIVAKGENT